MSRLDEEIRARMGALKSNEEGSKSGALILEMPRRKERYEAFRIADNEPPMKLTIYARQMYVMPPYTLLYDTVFAPGYDFVGLVYLHQRVKIFGRNLSGLVAGLQTNSVEWIRECVEGFFELPDDDRALPVITGIDIEGAPINPFQET